MDGELPEALACLQRSSWGPGAIRWAAPEHFLVGNIKRTTKSDIYSLGSLIFLASPPFIPEYLPSNFPGVVGQIPMVGSTSGSCGDVTVVPRLQTCSTWLSTNSRCPLGAH